MNQFNCEVTLKYFMESVGEARRLELQAEMSAYSIENEFSNLPINPGMRVLDAGCGHGMVSRYLHQRYGCEVIGLDYSETRIQQAKEFEQNSKISFCQSDLHEIKRISSSIDFAVSRYVFEYLKDPIQVCNELKRILKPSGKVLIVDLDGVTGGLKTKDTGFNQELLELCNKMSIDLFVGKKLNGFLKESGFKILEENITNHIFTGSELQQEIENIKKRFDQSEESISAILGRDGFKKFTKRYLELIHDSSSVYSFRKNWVMGEKC